MLVETRARVGVFAIALGAAISMRPRKMQKSLVFRIRTWYP